MNEKNQTARRYDRQFKENAVALVRGGRTITRVAGDLRITDLVAGVLSQACQRGPRTARASHPGRRDARAARKLRRLQQKNDYLRQQRDILKKALGISKISRASFWHSRARFPAESFSAAIPHRLEETTRMAESRQTFFVRMFFQQKNTPPTSLETRRRGVYNFCQAGAATTLLVPVMRGLVRALHRHVEILGLLRRERGQLDADFLQV